MAYDILIKSGLMLDGTGNTPTITDIGIKDGSIADIGPLGNAAANVTVNALQKYVTPGFIDATNHSDTYLTLFRYPYQESLIMQGVTTIVGGSCGASLAPLASEVAIRGISKWADPSEININWNTIGEFLGEISHFRPAVNIATCVGYGTIRRGIMGDEIRPANSDEREKMRYLIHQSMLEGAFGLSLGLPYGHERISTTEEIIDISRILASSKGIIKIHLRSEGIDILPSVNEAIRIGREAEVPVHISHLKAAGKRSWRYIPKVLDMIEHANMSGADITFDISPYATTGSLLYLLIPSSTRQGGFKELFQRIDNPEEKKRIIETIKGYTLHYDKIIITFAKIRNVVGKSVQEVANEAGITPEETIVDMVRANEGRVGIIGYTISSKNVQLEIQNKHSFISSDGAGYSQDASLTGNLVHPRSFGTFPHFWHRYVTESKMFKPEEAIKKMTSLPAQKFGFTKRGTLKKGMAADVVVFDPALFKDRATYQNPFRYPAGIGWVIINGNIAVENKNFLGLRLGKSLKKGSA